MNRSELLEEVSRISGVTNFGNLDAKDAERLLKVIGEQRLGEAHVRALIEIGPAFLTSTTEALKAIGTAAEGAKASQGEAFVTIKSSIDGIVDVLGRLADKADTDEARIKIAECVLEAAKLHREMSDIMKDMNKDNNDTWKTIAGIAAFALSVIGGIAMAVLGGRGGDRSNSA